MTKVEEITISISVIAVLISCFGVIKEFIIPYLQKKKIKGFFAYDFYCDKKWVTYPELQSMKVKIRKITYIGKFKPNQLQNKNANSVPNKRFIAHAQSGWIVFSYNNDLVRIYISQLHLKKDKKFLNKSFKKLMPKNEHDWE